MTFLCNRKKAVTDEIKAGANWNRSESQKTPDAGYSQSQVAALLCERGVYMTTDIYKKIEQNKYNIRISELNALKELYQVGYGELFQTDS